MNQFKNRSTVDKSILHRAGDEVTQEKKKLKMVIYGYGHCGKEFYRQLQRQSEYEVVCFLDKRYELYSNYFIPIYSPDQINDGLHFDYIVIAIENQQVVREVTHLLVEYGVASEKIITLETELFHKSAVCDAGLWDELLRDTSVIYNIFQDYEKRGYGNKSYFQLLIDEIKQAGDESVVFAITNLLEKEKLTPIQEIALVAIAYEADVIDYNLTKRFMSALSLLLPKQREDAYLFLCDIGHRFNGRPNGLYDTFFQDRRALMMKLCESYDLKIKKRKRQYEKTVISRIAMVVNQYVLEKKMLGVDGVVCQLANALVAKGYEVAIILTSPYENWNTCPYITPYGFHSFLSFENAETNRYYTDDRIPIFYRYEDTIAGKLQGVITDIEEFNPDVILDMADSLFISSAVVNTEYPIVRYTMRGNAFDTYFDMSVVFDKNQSIEWTKNYPYIEEDQLVEISGYGFKFDYLDFGTKEDITREAFGFLKDDFLVITVGTRLKAEMAEELAFSMKSLLEQNEKIRWVIVGERPDIFTEEYSKFIRDRRIILWGWEENLGALYEICDVFLNPKRIGGGISIRMAMQKGLPIAILDMPSDGKEIVGRENVIQGDYPELMSYILRLYNDKDLYQEMSEKMKMRIETLYSEKSLQELEDILVSAYNYHWSKR